jgi:hypothetical protein
LIWVRFQSSHKCCPEQTKNAKRISKKMKAFGGAVEAAQLIGVFA